MQTLKTAVVVVLLLVVFYGVYEMLNNPAGEPPPDVAQMERELGPLDDLEPPEIESGNPMDPMTPSFEPPTFELPTPIAPEMPAPPYGAYPTRSGENTTSENTASSRDDATSQPPGGGFYSPPPIPPVAQPDSPPSQPPSQARQPMLAEGAVIAIPGGAQMQHNPWVNGEAAPKPSTRSALGAQAYQRALGSAQAKIAEGDFRQALEGLSAFYKSPDLTPEQQRELLNLLDPLAAEVIYSKKHLMERPYTVGRSQTLMDIAQQYQVPYQLLQKINGIDNPMVLLPGSELKVVSGPFQADVDLQGQELTIFLDGYYAGRFPITLGDDPQPITGEFQVREKRPGKTYFSLNGSTIPAENPANPFGAVWLDLGRDVCIHGSPSEGMAQKRGCISLSPRDAQDVYSILSVGSKIRILR